MIPGPHIFKGTSVRSIDILTEWPSIRSLGTEWDDLVSDSRATVFQTFDWQRLWWECFAAERNQDPYVLALRGEDAELIGIAPLFIQKRRLAGSVIFRQLKLMGSGLESERSDVLSMETEGPADYLDVIARNGSEEIVGEKVAEFIFNSADSWDTIDLQNIPEDGVVANYLVPRLRDLGCETAETISDICPRVAIPEDWEDYFSTLDARTRRSFRRAEKTYLDSGEFSTDEMERNGNLEDGLKELSQLHQKHWNSIGYPGLFSDRRFAELQRALVESFGRKDRLWLTILRHKGNAVAARLCFVFNGRVYDYLSGMDKAAADSGRTSYSGAGTALLLASMKHTGSSGNGTFDLLRGNETYKFDLTSRFSINYHFIVSRRGHPGIFRSLAFKAVSGRFKVHSRITCEAAIVRTIRKESGILAAGPSYWNHLMTRLKRNRALPSRAGEGHTRTVTSNDAQNNKEEVSPGA